jgi:hypothetical protein
MCHVKSFIMTALSLFYDLYILIEQIVKQTSDVMDCTDIDLTFMEFLI